MKQLTMPLSAHSSAVAPPARAGRGLKLFSLEPTDRTVAPLARAGRGLKHDKMRQSHSGIMSPRARARGAD